MRNNKSEVKEKISLYFTKVMMSLAVLIIIYSCIFFIWDNYNNRLFEKKGELAIATIINMHDRYAEYDIEYNGVYYYNSIRLTWSAFRETRVGERFYALVIPDMLKYHHDRGITPRYVKIILSPLPTSEQDYDAEISRIKKQYGTTYGKKSPNLNPRNK